MNCIRAFATTALRSMTFRGNSHPPQEQYRLNVLRMLLASNISVSLLLIGYGITGQMIGLSTSPRIRLVALLVVPTIYIVFNLWVAWHTRHHYARLISNFLVGCSWLLSTLATFVSGGLFAPALLGVLGFLIVAALLLDMVWSLVLYVGTVLILGVLYWAEVQGVLPVVARAELPFQLALLWLTATLYFMVVWYHAYAVRQSERLLNITQVQAERLRVQQELTHNIAHDLRTPITILTNNAYLIKRKVERGLPIAENVTRLEEQAQTISKMIADLAMLIDLDNDPIHETHTPLRIVERLEQVVAGEREYAASRNITLTLADETGGKATVWGDPAQLDRVFENLIENAIHYGHDGGSVHLRVWHATDQNALAVAVRDDGIGIAPEHHQRIFERFYRVDPARGVHRNQSTGIGLYIVQQIVQRHGGRVTLESAPAAGSTFTVYLPLRA